MMIVAALSMTSAFPQDANKILETYFETIGQNKLVKINTITIVGKINQMGMEMTFKTISKRPNMGYLEAEVEGSLIKMAFDGKRGWMVIPMTGSDAPVDLTGPDLKQVKEIGDIDSPLWNWKEKGHLLEYAGSEDMAGTQVHILKLTKDDGDIISFYIDADKHLALKTKSRIMMNGSEVEMETFMSNYQDVEGIMQPFKVENSMSGQVASTIIMEEVRFDEEVDDAIFAKPGM